VQLKSEHLYPRMVELRRTFHLVSALIEELEQETARRESE
jgi:hypothetical protein